MKAVASLCLLLLFPRLSSSGAVSYEVVERPSLPCVLHVVKVPRAPAGHRLATTHAEGRAIGLAPLSEQLKGITSGIPVAAINGDYYERAGEFGGAPRGLQIIDGELLSAPSGSATFWLDGDGEPRAGATTSELKALFPDGARARIGLNSFRAQDRIVLYTPRFGPSTLTSDGVELELDPPGLPLRPQSSYAAIVREVGGPNSVIPTNRVVLSIGPGALAAASFRPGEEVLITTITIPSLKSARVAISGGPILVQNGKPQKFKAHQSDAYELSTMVERHPRSAFGWSKDFFVMVAADGRKPGRSMGMTLDQLAQFMAELGCVEAINFDGGGSSTLWHEGKIRNFLCDGYERDIANALVVVREVKP